MTIQSTNVPVPFSNHDTQLDDLQNDHPIQPTMRADRNNGTYNSTGTWQQRLPAQQTNGRLQNFMQARHMQQWVNDSEPNDQISPAINEDKYNQPSPSSAGGKNPQNNDVFDNLQRYMWPNRTATQ